MSRVGGEQGSAEGLGQDVSNHPERFDPGDRDDPAILLLPSVVVGQIDVFWGSAQDGVAQANFSKASNWAGNEKPTKINKRPGNFPAK